MKKSIIRILLILATITYPTINAQAKFHVELGYRYNIGIRERKIGTDLYLDHYNKYSYMMHLAALYNFTHQISAGIGILMRDIYTDKLDFVTSNNLSHSLGFGIGLVF